MFFEEFIFFKIPISEENDCQIMRILHMLEDSTPRCAGLVPVPRRCIYSGSGTARGNAAKEAPIKNASLQKDFRDRFEERFEHFI